MPGDCGIGSVRQADFLQAGDARPLREPRCWRPRGKKPSRTCSTWSRRRARFDGAADQARAFAENRDRNSVDAGDAGSSSFSLASRQLFQSACSWKASIFVPLRGQFGRDGVGESEIDVVAAQQDVIADGDAIELQLRRRVR